MNEQTPYDALGGDAGVKKLVDRFYDVMDQDPYAAPIRAMHAKDLRGSRTKLFLFLSGWLGGPDLYVEKYGHPRLRQRHLPFDIGLVERDQWMHCMRRALAESHLPVKLAQHLEQAFFSTADHMRNKPEYDPDARLRIVGR